MERGRHGDAAHFDRWAATYDRSPGQMFFGRIHRRVVDALLSGSAVPGRVVDVGCGTGRLLQALLSRLPGAELIGIDPSEGMISVARARFAGEPRVRLEVAGAGRLPLDDESADVVTTTMSFHHWEEQGAALGEVARVLAPGGRLVLADVLGIGLFGRLIRPRGHRHGAGYRDEAEMAGLLRGAGFASWRRRRIWPAVPIFLVEARRPAQHR
ncbi:MAG: class I SAM-dependent methyltransferase [Candidatus Dormibacteria bacterium]